MQLTLSGSPGVVPGQPSSSNVQPAPTSLVSRLALLHVGSSSSRTAGVGSGSGLIHLSSLGRFRGPSRTSRLAPSSSASARNPHPSTSSDRDSLSPPMSQKQFEELTSGIDADDLLCTPTLIGSTKEGYAVGGGSAEVLESCAAAAASAAAAGALRPGRHLTDDLWPSPWLSGHGPAVETIMVPLHQTAVVESNCKLNSLKLAALLQRYSGLPVVRPEAIAGLARPRGGAARAWIIGNGAGGNNRKASSASTSGSTALAYDHGYEWPSAASDRDDAGAAARPHLWATTVVGIISAADVKAALDSAGWEEAGSLTVADIMTSPARVICASSKVTYAAGLMLKLGACVSYEAAVCLHFSPVIQSSTIDRLVAVFAF